MTDITRAGGFQAQLGQTPGWSEIDQALGKLNADPNKTKHVRALAGQSELHVHDSAKWHGIGSPKAKYKEAVQVIKAAIDKDFGPGSGDLVFRNIGITKESRGLQLRDIQALRNEVAQLGAIRDLDPDALRAQLGGVCNRPNVKDTTVTIGQREVQISGQMIRDFGAGNGYTLKVGDKVALSSDEVAQSLYTLTRGDQSELLALSKATSQMGVIALIDSDDDTSQLKIDGRQQRVDFELARSENGYQFSIDYGAVVKGRGRGMDLEVADPERSRIDMQAKMEIPFDAFDNGNIDWSRVRFDGAEPPGLKLVFQPA